MRALMQAREPWPAPSTAAILDSEGGAERAWVVARRTRTRMEDTWRLMDIAAAMSEAVSLRL